MQITLSDTNGEFSIYLKEDFETLDDYIELLVKPVLRAAGFGEPLLDKYFVKEAQITLSDPNGDFSICLKEDFEALGSFVDWEVKISPAAEKKSAKKYWE